MATQHITDHGQHVEQIHARVRSLNAAFAGLGDGEDFDELTAIIHRPGWTTLPEILLVNSLIDAAERSAEQALALRTALVAGARAIGAAHEA
jgi:hypothetical protein